MAAEAAVVQLQEPTRLCSTPNEGQTTERNADQRQAYRFRHTYRYHIEGKDAWIVPELKRKNGIVGFVGDAKWQSSEPACRRRIDLIG